MERTNQSVREPVGWCEMNETCDRCGPAVRAAYRVQKLGNFTCAGKQFGPGERDHVGGGR